MNGYRIRAHYLDDRSQLRLVIHGSVFGPVSGNPRLERLPTDVEGELLLRLIFRTPIQHDGSGFEYTEWQRNLPQPMRHIRILLPRFQEFLLIARGPHPYHPITAFITDTPLT